MNKYSYKIKKFLDKQTNNIDLPIKNIENNKIIKLISEIFDESFNKKTNLVLEKNIRLGKLHAKSESSLLFKIMNVDNNFKSEYEFYRWFRTNYNKVNMRNDKYSEYHKILFNPPIDRLYLHHMMYDNIFVSLDVMKHSETEDLIYKIFTNENTSIHLYLPKNKAGQFESPNIDLIYRIINFYRILTKKNMFVKLVIFYGRQKKYLNTDDETLCPDNINSGSTIANEIIKIWRKEELYKVLIHELVHYFNIDFYVSDDIYKQINEYVTHFANVKGIDRINESYTETLAIVIHSVLYSKLNNVSINRIITDELLFTYFQVSKILKHFNCNDCDVSVCQINQTTSAFSYYIIKCMFVCKIEEVLKYWENNGFVILGESEDMFIEFYKRIININTLDKHLINYFFEVLEKYTKSEKKNNFIIKTMRMSAYEIY